MMGAIQIVSSALVPEGVVWRQKPDLVYCGPRAYRAILWETSGRKQWAGRDRRRIKRERRKFMAQPA